MTANTKAERAPLVYGFWLVEMCTPDENCLKNVITDVTSVPVTPN
jgi:hypothetical protein